LQHHKNERHEKKVLLLDRHSPDSSEKLILGINKILTAEITTHHDGNKLMFLIDVDKLMNIFKLLGAIEDNKTNETLIKLTKKIPTLQAGFSFEKVK
jgi:hypothetical protein